MSNKKKELKKALMLDRETSHGGWPNGPNRGWVDDRPVNVIISDYLEKMGMLDTPDHARLSEARIRKLIRVALFKEIKSI
jgi:hypothetical protein